MTNTKKKWCVRVLCGVLGLLMLSAVGFTALRASAAEDPVQTQTSETVTDESTQETTYGAPIAFALPSNHHKMEMIHWAFCLHCRPIFIRSFRAVVHR